MIHYLFGILYAIIALGLTAGATHLSEQFIGQYHLIYLSVFSYLGYSLVIKIIHHEFFVRRKIFFQQCLIIFGIWLIAFSTAIYLSEHASSLVHILFSPMLSLFIAIKSSKTNLVNNLLNGAVFILILQVVVFIAIYQ